MLVQVSALRKAKERVSTSFTEGGQWVGYSGQPAGRCDHDQAM